MEENKTFSEIFSESTFAQEALRMNSVNAADADHRLDIYDKVFTNYESLVDDYRTFTGAGDTGLIGNQYMEATITSYVRSWAGQLSIERFMDQSDVVLWWLDLIGATDNRIVDPNIGQDNLGGIDNNVQLSSTVVSGSNSITTGIRIVPGSVKLILTHVADGSMKQVVDDTTGSLIGAPGILSAGTINYLTGAISFTPGSGFVPASGDTYQLNVAEDQAGMPDYGVSAELTNNVFKAGWRNFLLKTRPGMLIAQDDLISMAGARKATGANKQGFLQARLAALYTKRINLLMTKAIMGASGSALAIDISAAATGFNDYRSKIDAFQGATIEIETALAGKSAKASNVTSYLCGYGAADWFQKTAQIGLFKKNTDTTYVDDLIGWYQGIPVFRHSTIPTNTGMGICKTTDGAMAPVLRGCFLPVTTTPVVGNFKNPTQVSNGIFYQEGHELISSNLVQKFTITA